MSGLGLHTGDYSLTEDDSLWEMAEETKKLGNKYVKESRFADAIQRYSEVIMQCRGMKPEVVKRKEEEIRALIQSCYLNLAMCFLKAENWTHAYNTAHRALYGDEDPPNPKHDVLNSSQKAKALFRKCTAALNVLDGVAEKTENFAPATIKVSPTMASIDKDVTKALSYEPKDAELLKMQKTVRERLREEKKDEKARMKGFLGTEKFAKSIGGNDDRAKADQQLDPKKLEAANLRVDGQDVGGEDADHFTEMIGELNEMVQDDPETFQKLKEKIRAQCEANDALPEKFLEKGAGAPEESATPTTEAEAVAAATT
ncbi:unnamed protein product [Amoebophrya sp. A120]|nr:unnamed protein product [Amoebophrya sp. A120]|eukprot:GSA120T00005022001.1